MSSVPLLGASRHPTPLQLLQQELTKEGSAETLNSSSQSAASSAPDKIDISSNAIRADETSGNQTSPDDLKTKIYALINNEVNNGRLTSEQASKIQNAFSSAFEPSSSHDGIALDSGKPPAGGATDAIPSAEGTSSATAPNTLNSSETTAGTSPNDLGTILNGFLKLLQDAQSTASSYGARGNSSASTTATGAQLINYSA